MIYLFTLTPGARFWLQGLQATLEPGLLPGADSPVNRIIDDFHDAYDNVNERRITNDKYDCYTDADVR